MAGVVRLGYVGGIGRSGSTLLCRALSRLDGVCHVGEICYLWNQSVRNNRLCSCGLPFRSCPFWSAVGDVAFGGWDRAPVDRADALRRRVERNRNLLQLAGGRGPAGFGAALAEYAGLMDAVFAAVRDVSGATVVLDNSKLPSTAYLRRYQPGVDLRLVHLVRSSYGVAHSWAKEFEREDGAGAAGPTTMRTFSPGTSSFEWGAYNFALRRLAGLGVPTTVVRYEDVIADPRTQLSRIAQLFGLTLRPDSLDFLGEGTVDLAPDHSVWGNPTRLRNGRQALRVDDAWRTAMSPRTRATVTALSLPGLLRYGYLRPGYPGRRAR